MAVESPSLEFVNVVKRYPSGLLALDHVSFRVEPGQVVALLGTSGSGKTTALKLMNRLEDCTAGTVLLNSKPVNDCDSVTLRRSIGYVIQEGGLFPHWNVADNVALVPRLLEWPEERVSARVRTIMELMHVPFDEFALRYPATLSGGQRQRVAIARALAAESNMLLLDEAFGALDPITRDALHIEVKALIAQLRVTTVIVTHDVSEAFKLAGRVALLHQGRLVQFGAPEELMLTPANEFVREFFRHHGLDLKLKFLKLDGIAPFLSLSEDHSDAAVELRGEESLADALEKMAVSGAEQFVICCGDGMRRGPYSRKCAWNLLRKQHSPSLVESGAEKLP